MRRPKFGISTRDVEAFRNQVDLPTDDGVLIIQVARGGGARWPDFAGCSRRKWATFELGDIIVGIDNDKVANSDDLFRVLDKHQIGDTVQVQIWRNGRRMSVPVRLMESLTRDADRERQICTRRPTSSIWVMAGSANTAAQRTLNANIIITTTSQVRPSFSEMG